VIAGGLFSGVYCSMFVPYHVLVYAVLSAATCAVCVMVSYFYFPSPRSEMMIKLAFVVFVALLPTAMVIQNEVFGSAFHSQTRAVPRGDSYATQMKLRMEGARVALFSLYAVLCFLVALLFAAVPHAGRRVRGLKARVEQQRQRQQRRHASRQTGVVGVDVQSAAGVIGNLCCVGSCCAALYVHVGLAHGSEAGVLWYAPVLLLLRSDGWLVPASISRHKYDAVYWAVVLILLATVLFDLFLTPALLGAQGALQGQVLEESVVLWHLFDSSQAPTQGQVSECACVCAACLMSIECRYISTHMHTRMHTAAVERGADDQGKPPMHMRPSRRVFVQQRRN
jgi:hypothetical protein